MQLLISVRSSAEARAAAAGGADIIDLKDPAAGPLGMVAAPAQNAIAADLAAAGYKNLRLSAALGEVTDWSDVVVPTLPQLQFAKLGLAGLRPIVDWSARWQLLRHRIAASQTHSPNWIAVSYADYSAAKAPEPAAVVEQACATGCQGLLLDTWDKSGPSLWGHLTQVQVSSLIRTAQAAGLLVALAGRLGIDDVDRCEQLGADIFAVRSAACGQGQRTNAICPDAVTQLVNRLSAPSTTR